LRVFLSRPRCVCGDHCGDYCDIITSAADSACSISTRTSSRILSRAEGDLLHFTNMDANETVAGNQDFTFIDQAAFTAAGQISWSTNGVDTFIQLNTNADPTVDGIFQVLGVHTVDASWFSL
jgi:hypothetical protein